MAYVKTSSTWDQLMVPALAGAAGTGALSGYLSSRTQDPDETPSQRRRRIIRNALLGAGVGGLAGAAVPGGLNILQNRGGGTSPTLAHRFGTAALEHPTITGAGLAGLGAAAMQLRKGKLPDAVLKHVGALAKSKLSPTALSTAVRQPASLPGLRDVMVANLKNTEKLTPAFATTKANELLRLAGARHADTTGAPAMTATLRSALQEHPGIFSKFIGDHVMDRGPSVFEQKLGDRVGQWYSRLVSPTLTGSTLRPSLPLRMLNSVPTYMLGGAAAGNVAGEYVPGLGQ